MWWLTGLALAAALLLAVGCAQTRRVRMAAYRYADAAVPQAFDGFRIAQISDYHDSPFPRHGKKLLSAVREARPDVIVLTGDAFDRKRPHDCAHTFALVEEAVHIAPVLFVEGNHERRITGYPLWRRRLIALGVIVLEDDALTLFRDGSELRVVGMRQAFDTSALRRLCAGFPFALVLSHRSECAGQYALAGKALILTGHAHGGQIRLAGKGAYAPDQGVLPRYVAGAYRAGGATVYVSRGIGNTIRFPRIFDTPEWNLVTLSCRTDTGREDVC